MKHRLLVIVSFFVGLLIVTQTVLAKPSAVKIKNFANENWVEVSTKNFKITSNAKPDKLEKLAVELEDFRFFVSRVLKFTQVDGVPPLNFVVLKNDSSFNRLGFDNIGGIFTSNPRGFFSIANGDDFKLKDKRPTWGRHVIFHEMIHYFESNHLTKKTFPRWYREGNAEYLATAVHKGNKVTFGRMDVLKWRFYSMEKPSGAGYYSVDIEDLFKAKDYIKSTTKGKRKRAREASRFYARAFITMHYLNSSPLRRKQLDQYVNLLNDDKTVDEAFNEAFKISYDQLSGEVDKYLTGKSIYGRVFKTGEGGLQFPKVAVSVKKLSPKEAILTVVDTRLQFQENAKDGADIKESIFTQLDIMFPDDDELLILKTRYDSRLANAERIKISKALVTKYPKSETANVLMGNSYTAVADALRRRGDDRWRNINLEARRYYRKAVKLNKFSGEAYQGIADSYRYTSYTEKTILEGALCYENVSVLVKFDRNLSRQGHLYAGAGQYEDAYDAYKRYTEVSDSDYSLHFITWARDALSLHFIPKTETVKISGDVITYTNGAEYKGDVSEGLPHGVGAIVYPNGVEYHGAWREGLPHGTGDFVATNGMTYSGDFLDGAVHGNGRLVYDTWTYEGEFHRYMEHGEGVASYENGSRVISGSWHRGMRHGVNRVSIGGAPEKSIEWISGSPKLDLGDKGTFIGAPDFATMSPLDGAKGLCKTPNNNHYYDCTFKDGELQRL